MPINHIKTSNIPDPTQLELDAQIALGNYPPGTLLADIALSSDWNANHTNPDIADVTGLQAALDAKASGESLYIQNTEPSWTPGQKGLWIDTTGGNLNFKVQLGA